MTSTGSRDRSQAALLALLVLFSLLLRLWPVSAIEHIWEDAYYYLELARSLSHGHYNLLGSFHAKYLPGFPLAVLLARIISFGSLSWFLTGQCVLTLCSSLLPVMCFFLVIEVAEDRPAAWAAAILASLNPFLVAYSGIPFSECFYAFLLVASLLLLARRPLLAGLAGGLCALTRHEGWLMLPVFLVYHIEFTKTPPFLKFDLSRRRSLVFGAAAFLLAGGFWWVLSYLKSGELLFSIYTTEAAQKSMETGHAGVDFLKFSFPVGGHIATLFALAGLAPAAGSRSGRAVLFYLFLYAGLHMWWVGVLERYFVVLVPLLCVLAGLGISETVKLASDFMSGLREHAPKKARVVGMAVPLVAVLAGAFHFVGYGPAFIKEQASRSEGYVEAVEYVDSVSQGKALLAYDVFLAGFHAPHTPVIPSGLLPASEWTDKLPELFVKRELRYIVWSPLYPLDKKKSRLGGGFFLVRGKVQIGGHERRLVLAVFPDKRFHWRCYYPGPDRLAWFRNSEWKDLEAVVYKVKRAGSMRSRSWKEFD
ncbi:MAG: hypothetical protein R6V10_02735 [bacterium]